MIKALMLTMLIGLNAHAGLKANIKTKTYKIYSFDSSKVILKDLKGKKKWVMSRTIWKEKPSIGKKITLSESYIKKLQKYKAQKK
jgi:hypothetical protein